MSEGRTLLFVLDSLGIGGAPDASDYDNDGVPDEGANTLLHIAQSCHHGHCDGRAEYEQSPRSGALYLPNLTRLGLGHAAVIADGQMPPGLDFAVSPGSYAALQETSRGKDTPSGHYELCGVPVDFDWGYFPKTVPCFPSGLIDAFIDECQLPGILGNKHASGTDIIRELGPNTARQDNQSCTQVQIACCKLRPMSKASASIVCMKSAKSLGASVIR